jgi:small-conductance mechanosensitive channel
LRLTCCLLDRDAQKKIETDRLTEENNKLREQVNLLKSQITEQTRTNLKLSQQLKHAKGEMEDGVLIEDTQDRVNYFKERKANSASNMSSKIRPLTSLNNSGSYSSMNYWLFVTHKCRKFEYWQEERKDTYGRISQEKNGPH